MVVTKVFCSIALPLNLSSSDWRDALPREEQEELEESDTESDTEEKDFFGDSVKEDSMNFTPYPLPREQEEESEEENNDIEEKDYVEDLKSQEVVLVEERVKESKDWAHQVEEDDKEREKGKVTEEEPSDVKRFGFLLQSKGDLYIWKPGMQRS